MEGSTFKGANGIAPIIKVYTNKQGEFISGEIISAKQIQGGKTVLDNNNQAIKTLQQLLKQDFPECQLSISDKGFISITNNN